MHCEIIAESSWLSLQVRVFHQLSVLHQPIPRKAALMQLPLHSRLEATNHLRECMEIRLRQ